MHSLFRSSSRALTHHRGVRKHLLRAEQQSLTYKLPTESFAKDINPQLVEMLCLLPGQGEDLQWAGEVPAASQGWLLLTCEGCELTQFRLLQAPGFFKACEEVAGDWSL